MTVRVRGPPLQWINVIYPVSTEIRVPHKGFPIAMNIQTILNPTQRVPAGQSLAGQRVYLGD